MGRLIVDGKGTEKVIRKPAPPPKDAIVFPDKKSVDVSWRRNFQRVIATQEAIKKAEVGQEEATVVPNLEYPELPMLMAVITDTHIFSQGTDHERLLKHLDLIINEPNVRMVDVGDSVDMGIWGTMVFEQILSPAMQGFTIKSLAEELKDRMLVSVDGNHNHFMKVAGTEFYEAYLTEAPFPIFPSGGLIHLKLGKETYDIALKHTHWGHSKLNATNASKRFMQYGYPDADVAILGHTHQAAMEQFYSGGRQRLAVVGGTYKLDDQWAKRRGIATHGERGGLGILFYPDRHEFVPFLHLEDGVRYLQALIRLKEMSK